MSMGMVQSRNLCTKYCNGKHLLLNLLVYQVLAEGQNVNGMQDLGQNIMQRGECSRLICLPIPDITAGQARFSDVKQEPASGFVAYPAVIQSSLSLAVLAGSKGQKTRVRSLAAFTIATGSEKPMFCTYTTDGSLKVSFLALWHLPSSQEGEHAPFLLIVLLF